MIPSAVLRALRRGDPQFAWRLLADWHVDEAARRFASRLCIRLWPLAFASLTAAEAAVGTYAVGNHDASITAMLRVMELARDPIARPLAAAALEEAKGRYLTGNASAWARRGGQLTRCARRS